MFMAEVVTAGFFPAVLSLHGWMDEEKSAFVMILQGAQ